MEEDRNLEKKIQNGVVKIMGPLSRIWMGVDSMKDSIPSEVNFHGLTQA